MVRMLFAVVLVWSSIVGLVAQNAKPAFEVASIRRGAPPSVGEIFSAQSAATRSAPGVFNRTSATVEGLLLQAYDLLPIQLVGAPDWVKRDIFHIQARTTEDATPAQIRLMVQSLLEDRFKLMAHVESRDMRYLALVRARPDGTLGPSLLRIDGCSGAIVSELRRKDPERYPAPLNALTSGCSGRGLRLLTGGFTSELQMLVVDETGLTDDYYWSLRYQRPGASGRAAGGDLDLPVLTTALQEQLGLKLEARKGPVDVLVIESVDQPSEN